MSDLKEEQVKTENFDARELGTSSLEVSNSAGQEILLIHQMSKMKMILVDLEVNIPWKVHEFKMFLSFKVVVESSLSSQTLVLRALQKLRLQMNQNRNLPAP